MRVWELLELLNEPPEGMELDEYMELDIMVSVDGSNYHTTSSNSDVVPVISDEDGSDMTFFGIFASKAEDIQIIQDNGLDSISLN
jgi:hypothetical protein